MASLLEIIESNRNKGAGTGEVSASAQSSNVGKNNENRGTLLSYIEAARQNKQTGSTPYSQTVGQLQRPGGLYSQAARENRSTGSASSGGTGLSLTQIIQQRRESGLYSQALQNMQQRQNTAPVSVQDDRGAGTNAARGTSALLSGVLDKADNRESSLYSSAYADILRRQDYAQNSQAGESKIRGFSFNNDERYDYINNIGNERERADLAQRRGTGARDFGKYAFMTQDEVGVYNYLYATEGKKAANAFLDELEPELDKQWYSGVERNTTDWTGQNALTKTIGSAATVIAQPARTMTSALAVGEDALRMLQGKEINPYSGLRQVSRLSQDVRNDVAEDMGDVGRFAYQTAMSAADSAVNSLVAGGLAGGLGLSGDALMKTTNVIGSSLMSSEVTSMGIAESKEKGYSDIGALSLGLVRGGFEYLSEAIGGEWAIRNIKANPNSFLRSMMLNAIPEGVEEVMSDAANEGLNLVIDKLFDTEESYIGQAYKYFKENGTDAQKKNPELWTMLTILQQEGLSFLGGAAATIGTSGVQFANYHRSIIDASRRLNTTPETVQQIMGELGTDNPAAVDLLAQLHGVNNAEDLRSRIGEAKTAAEAIDAAMRQQGQNENAARGRAALNVEAGRGILNENVRRALQMQQEGRSPNEIYNETGLSSLSNGRFRDMQTGEIFDTGGYQNDQRTDVENNTGILQGAESRTGEAGSSGEADQRLLRPERSWAELPEQNRTAAAETVRRYIESSDSEELTELQEAFRDTGAVPEAEIARRVYQDLQIDPIVAENTWGGLFTDINGLLNELSREGGAYEQQSADRGQENGNAGIGTGGEAGGVYQEEQRGQGALPGGEAEVRSGLGEGNGQDLRQVTPASLGITGGDTTRTVQILRETDYSESDRAAAENARRAGAEPVLFRGEMIVNGQSVNGWHENGKAYIRTDATYSDGTPIPSEGIGWHESFHEAAERDPSIVKAGMAIIREGFSEERVRAMKEAYREAYKNIYDFENMSVEDIERLIETELVGDAGGKLNRFRDNGRIQQQIREGLAARMQQTATQERTDTRGPPEEGTAEISVDFADDFQKWMDAGKPDQNRLYIGKTSQPLQDIGIDSKKIYWDTSKINKLQEDHPEMSDKVLAQVPEILEHPILIMESTTQPNRVTLFGEVYGENDLPVMAVLELLPSSRNGRELNLIKIANSYTLASESDLENWEFSPEKTQKKINESTVLYVDPDRNRTDGWLYRNRLQLPLGITTYGPIGRVSLFHRDVNGKFTADSGTQEMPEWKKKLQGFDLSDGGRGSLEVTTEDRKQRQAEIILQSNPHDDSLGEHTWIRSADDVHTFEEGLAEDGIEDGEGVTPDYTAQMIADAKRTGQITVYSSHPIQAGTFVTPSAMEARSYAGSGPIYSQTVRTADVAWLDSIQGQYAPVTEESSPVTRNERGGQASVEVEAESTEDLRRELREREQAYQDAMAVNDPDFDYRGTNRRIQEIESRLREMDTTSAPDGAPSHQGEGVQVEASQGEATEMEQAERDLKEVGESRIRTEDGECKMLVRMKKDGGYLASVDRNGRREISRTFASAEEAADFALGYVQGQEQAREDSTLDRERSAPIRQQGALEALFTGEVQDEAERLKKNKAAEAATQTLRERIRRTEAEIQALSRLEKTTGLTEQQRAHKADLEQTRDIMNDELTARKGRAAKKKTAKTEVTGNRPTQSAGEAKNALMDLFHTASGERAEVGRRIEQKLAEIADNGHLTEQSRDELIDMLIEAGAVPKQAETAYQEARNWLRGTRIYVDEHERADFGDNWDSLRKRAWANGIYLTGDIRDGRIDTINRQLADTFGENMFPTDSALSDMLGNMIDQAERGRTTQQSLADAIEGEARATGESARTIYEDMFRQMDETLRTFAEKAGLEVELKNRTATELAAERKRWEDRMERRAQQRRETEIRNKTLNGLRRLEKLRGKAAPEVRTQVDEVLRDIDTYARRLTLSGIEDLQALQRTYEEAAKTAGFVDDENPGNFIRNPYVEERLARLSQKHIDDMDIGEVIELGRVVAALETTIRNQNEMIGEEWDRTIQETSEAVRSEVNNTRGARPGFLQKWFMEEHLSPRRFLEMLGGWKNGTMRKLSQSLEDGQTRQLDFQRRAMQSFDDFVHKKENQKWLETASGKKAVWQKYGVVNGMAMDGSGFTGQSIEITPMMRVALYMHSLNEDNLRHIQTGGLVIPNKALYQQGKIQEAYAQGEKVKMQPQAVRAIAAQLTEQEKNFANHLQKFFDTMSKAAINEVSLQLDGFERAGVDHYFPIESSSSYLKSDVAGEARAQTVEGIGSIANERVHASNPIMLSDASEVLLRQIDKVSRYYGYAIPIRNFQAVNNYVFHDEGNAFAGSIKDTINKKWGAGAENYITKMLADLQSGGRRSDMMGSALAKLRGNLAGATLMFNPSVAVSQAASYPGAAQALGWDALAAGLVPRRVDTKLMEKYTPLYWYRNQGNSTQELGDALKEKGLEQKLPWALNWIQKMDSLTIRRLWAAAEYRVSKDNPNLRPGSKAQIDAGEDAYYKKVAEVFNRAVYDTQPNYTNMERAQILRSDSDVTKFLTMYKTVPLQYYGMMVEAAGRLNAAMHGGTETEKAEARKYFANTMGGLLAANSVYVVMKALFKGFRKKDDDYRDEEGNLTAASAGKQLGKELLEVYAGSVIGGAEAYSAAQALITGSKWRGPEMSALSHVEDIVNGIGSIFTALDSQDPRKAAGAVKNAAANIAMAMGVPAKNAETYIMAAIRWAAPEVAMEYDNMFGGIDKSNLRGMDEETLGTATNIILRNRTGARLDPSVTDELARLYSAGYREAVPTAIPENFTYGDTTVEIEDRKAYSETWGGIVGDNLEELLTADAYVSGDDATKKAMIDRLYDYATVQARKGADPDYDPSSSSTYAWTVKADECVAAGVSLPDTISAMAAIGGMTADKDANGNSISGSKKEKVVAYINSLDMTDEQKDALYLTVGGYKESTLDTTPWNNGSGKYTSSGRRSGRRGGGGRRSSGTKAKAVSGAGKIGQISRSNRGGSDNALAALFGGAGSTVTTANRKSADASTDLLDIVNRYYGGNPLAAAMDGGRKARTSVDFKL